jgi:hypothetical protein
MRRQWLTISIVWTLLVYGCAAATYSPRSLEEATFKSRAQTQEDGGVQVTAAVLSAEECKMYFRLDLYRRGIQPIWLRIENNTKQLVAFLRYGVDSDYFSPLEVSYIHRAGFSQNARYQMDEFFHQQQMKIYIPPGGVDSGFVFTHLDRGTKAFNVDVLGEYKDLRSFTFFVSVPGLRVSHSRVDITSLYSEDEMVTYDDDQSLRKGLESLLCCTSNEDNTEQGAPLNLVIIGKNQDLHRALIRSGWTETEALSGKAATARSKPSILGDKYAVVSPLYVYGRPQDAAFTKARKAIRGRSILRLWLTPMQVQEESVWIGQVSRKVGVRSASRPDLTYRIDPALDDARGSFLQNMWYSQGLARYGFVKGVKASPISEPRLDLKGDPYITDGYRAVLWPSSRPISLTKVKFVQWEFPPER